MRIGGEPYMELLRTQPAVSGLPYGSKIYT